VQAIGISICHAEAGSEVKDNIRLTDDGIYCGGILHVANNQLEIWVVEKMLDVGFRAFAEIVEGSDAMTVSQQAFGQMRANEPGATGDDNVTRRRADFLTMLDSIDEAPPTEEAKLPGHHKLRVVQREPVLYIGPGRPARM